MEIITPERQLFKGECDLVQMPGSDGLFEVLKNHAPMIASLGVGKVKVANGDSEPVFFDIRGGVAEIHENNILILAD